jgi:hypothetical protein
MPREDPVTMADLPARERDGGRVEGWDDMFDVSIVGIEIGKPASRRPRATTESI